VVDYKAFDSLVTVVLPQLCRSFRDVDERLVEQFSVQTDEIRLTIRIEKSVRRNEFLIIQVSVVVVYLSAFGNVAGENHVARIVPNRGVLDLPFLGGPGAGLGVEDSDLDGFEGRLFFAFDLGVSVV
jgi:hypothetical protein